MQNFISSIKLYKMCTMVLRKLYNSFYYLYNCMSSFKIWTKLLKKFYIFPNSV